MGDEVDWKVIAEDWLPSGTAVRVTDESEINAIIGVLEQFAYEDLELSTFGGETVANLIADNTDPERVVERAAMQLREHRLLWKTHPDESTFALAFEMPFAQKGQDILRYFKMRFKKISGWERDQTFVAAADISYHVSKYRTKVRYEK